MMNTSSLDGGTEEDAEDSSSTSLNDLPNQFRSALDEFREKWQKELKSYSASDTTSKEIVNGVDDEPKSTTSQSTVSSCTTTEDGDDENRAKEYFMQGIEFERRGKVYEALHYYRRAIQIVPDIEFRIHDHSRNQQQQQQPHLLETNNNLLSNSEASNNSIATVCKMNSNSDNYGDENEDLSNVNLRARFQYSIFKNSGKLIERTNSDPSIITTGAHVSDLPTEIILYILRWVVSSQLDVRSLEKCSTVCKGLYLCARDEEIWKSICLKVWGVNTGLLKNSVFPSWRQMFIERHRINFNGCYISKTSYLRYGENSFQDQFYRPVQLIEYYRYIRFLPDGNVMMMTSADEPAQTVSKLNNISNNYHQLRNDILKGHYRLHGDLVVIMLKRFTKSHNSQMSQQYCNKKQRENNSENSGGGVSGGSGVGAGIHTFYIELKIASTSKRRFCQLQWKHYSIIQIKNKTEISTDFELTTAKYPPLWFSRVKSYHVESDMPLK